MFAVVMNEKKNPGFVEIVQEYGSRLFSFIRGRVKTDEEAEDIMQDVWYQLGNVMDTETIETLSSWLYTVAKNKITDLYRKKKPVYMEDFVYEDEDGEVNYGDILYSDFPAPEDDQLRQLFWEEFYKALDELPQEQRDVFIMNEMEDMTFREMSEKTGENIKTLISRKRYAILHLRKRLGVFYKELLTQ